MNISMFKSHIQNKFHMYSKPIFWMKSWFSLILSLWVEKITFYTLFFLFPTLYIMWTIMQIPRSLEKAVVLEKVEEKRKEHLPARWMNLVTMAMSISLEDLKKQIRDRSLGSKSIYGVTTIKKWPNGTYSINQNNSTFPSLSHLPNLIHTECCAIFPSLPTPKFFHYYTHWSSTCNYISL